MYHALIQPDFASWRTTARRLLASETPPDQVVWTDARAESGLLPGVSDEQGTGDAAGGPRSRVPAEFVATAKTVAYHRDELRWPLLYRLLWRLTRGEPHLLHVTTDDDVIRLASMERSVRRDIHKAHAFVRFRSVLDEDGDEQYVAFHRPDHLIVPAIGPWFAKRFPVMAWSILTPDQSVRWDLNVLHYGPGVPASAAPAADELEAFWKTYYASIFNPARVKVAAMKKEMPVRHWRTLPEAELIDDLLRQASPRVEGMMAKHKADESKPQKPAAKSAAAFVPPSRELPVLKAAARACQGCDLYCHATQVVFGEGPADARIVFVGEQPGDQEDLAGRPFVGPAGQLFDRALQEAGVDRKTLYVTNAVKHFSFVLRGKRRLHQTPKVTEIRACRPWIDTEVARIAPTLVVAMGASAAQSVFGRVTPVQKSRRQVFEHVIGGHRTRVMVTVHPSYLLRLPDEAAKAEAYAEFVDDLRMAQRTLSANDA